MNPTKEEKRKKLIDLRKKALDDDSLPLKEGATNLVFGEGNVEAEILFIGEGPGHWEDVKARPFVGNAGALLNQMLDNIEIERKDVFITNVIMYRPPDNRDPNEEEIEAFAPYIDGIVETISPKMVVTLGRFSMAKFIPNVMISNVHGKPRDIEWKGIEFIVLPMYHPAAALRNGDIKFKFKRDFEQIPQILKDTGKVDDTISKEDENKQMNLV
jgi:uracil-DNA glycosylase family 4